MPQPEQPKQLIETRSINGRFWKIERPAGGGGLYVPVEIEVKAGAIVGVRRGVPDMWSIVEDKISRKMHDQTYG